MSHIYKDGRYGNSKCHPKRLAFTKAGLCRECYRHDPTRRTKELASNRKRMAHKSEIRFGINYIEQLVKQQGKCAICYTSFPGKSNAKRILERFAIDHNHITNKTRGLLCRNCNTGLGLFNDSIERLMLAINYLSQYD